MERKVAAAQDMITDMYLPHLEAADIEFSVNVHVVDGQRSAAGIAEQVVQAATNAGSDLLAVISHGGCASLYLRQMQYLLTHLLPVLAWVPVCNSNMRPKPSPMTTEC